jgi:hypothetical protein
LRRCRRNRRSGTSSLFAVLNAATSNVIRQLHNRHRAIEFKKFLQTIDNEVLAGLDVHLILNNYSTHKTPAIHRWLTAHPRFHLHFTPTSGSWLNLVSSEQTHTQAQLLFARALEGQGLLGPDGLPPDRHQERPILVTWSDNGAEMTAIDTRHFMALMTIAQHHGRPGTPTDQAQVESFFSHLKGDWPHLTEIRDPAALDTELARIRREYNTVRLHAAIGYVTPDDEDHGRGPQIRRARLASMRRARTERIKQNRASKK